jgi:Beta-propeller repeat/Fibronectin type III domain
VLEPDALRKRAPGFSWVLLVLALLPLLLISVPIARHPAGHRIATSGSPVAPMASQPQPIAPTAGRQIRSAYARLPIVFEENRGQANQAVRYIARANPYTLLLTSSDLVFSLRSASGVGGRNPVGRGPLATPPEVQVHADRSPRKASSTAIHMQLIDGNLSNLVASSELAGKSNYFIGNDPGKWLRNVPLYARASYQNVYHGVDLAFHGERGRLEFDFLVAPGANPRPIGFHFSGTNNLKLDRAGGLVISSRSGSLLLHQPFAYQEQNGSRQEVTARFALAAANRVTIELGPYDRTRELVIDPSVSYAYSTYLGGSLEDDGFGVAVDSSGNAYITGQTDSTNFPTSGGVLPNSNAGGFDVFVTKISPTGSSLVYSTYVGGVGNDSGNAIAVDASGDAFVTGGTSSNNFPTTPGAFQTTYGTTASSNAFIFELNPAGNALTYSTYLGGTVNDVAYGVALDSSGNAYSVGVTSSPDFPTLNPLQACAGDDSGFLSKLNSSGTALVYSTCLNLGGSIGDAINAVAVDSSGNAYVTGATSSSSFHTTSGAVQTQFGGGVSDAFVTVINAAGNDYIYSTFLGGSGSDLGNGIAVDSSFNVYVTGSTGSSNFPVKSAYQSAFAGGNADAFVSKINAAGSALVYSTYLGGGQFDAGAGIAVDSGGNAYLTGQTDSLAPAPFPTTANATQSALAGGFDAFVSELNPAGAQLLFSTYLGGSANEDSSGGKYGAIAVDNAGANIYVTGDTASNDFPTQSPLYPSMTGGAFDAFVTKYSQPSFALSATAFAAVPPGSSATSTITLTSLNGYDSPVNLTCTVSGTASPLPSCSATSFSANPVTPTSAGAPTTLTITTTGLSGTALQQNSGFFYALWLPITGLPLIVGLVFSSSGSCRKGLSGFLVICVSCGLLLIPACGGSSGGASGGDGTCNSAPSTPAGLAASGTTTTGTTLNWNAAAVGANCSVTGYTVYENGKSIGTPSNTTFNVASLTAGTQYRFTVAASDSAGTSPQSTPISVTTLSSGTPAGTYTVTITAVGTDANQTTESSVLTLTVN